MRLCRAQIGSSFVLVTHAIPRRIKHKFRFAQLKAVRKSPTTNDLLNASDVDGVPINIICVLSVFSYFFHSFELQIFSRLIGRGKDIITPSARYSSRSLLQSLV